LPHKAFNDKISVNHFHKLKQKQKHFVKKLFVKRPSRSFTFIIMLPNKLQLVTFDQTIYYMNLGS